jgi:hypothetical protein
MDLLLAHPPALSGHFQSEDVFYPGLHTHLEDLRRWRQIKLVFSFSLDMPTHHCRQNQLDLPPSAQIFQVGMQAGVEYGPRLYVSCSAGRAGIGGMDLLLAHPPALSGHFQSSAPSPRVDYERRTQPRVAYDQAQRREADQTG